MTPTYAEQVQRRSRWLVGSVPGAAPTDQRERERDQHERDVELLIKLLKLDQRRQERRAEREAHERRNAERARRRRDRVGWPG